MRSMVTEAARPPSCRPASVPRTCWPGASLALPASAVQRPAAAVCPPSGARLGLGPWPCRRRRRGQGEGAQACSSRWGVVDRTNQGTWIRRADPRGMLRDRVLRWIGSGGRSGTVRCRRCRDLGDAQPLGRRPSPWPRTCRSPALSDAGAPRAVGFTGHRAAWLRVAAVGHDLAVPADGAVEVEVDAMISGGLGGGGSCSASACSSSPRASGSGW